MAALCAPLAEPTKWMARHRMGLACRRMASFHVVESVVFKTTYFGLTSIGCGLVSNDAKCFNHPAHS
jgi:hypothetical protein